MSLLYTFSLVSKNNIHSLCACFLFAPCQGRVEVEIGKEGLKFENGAFTYYGVSALTLPSSGEFTKHRIASQCRDNSPED